MSIFVSDVCGDFEAEVHPYEDGAKERAVEEVDCKGILAEPEKVFVGENVLDWSGEMDSQRNELETDTRVEARGFIVLRKDVDRGLAHDLGPAHPLCFVFRVRGEEKPNDNDYWGEDSLRPFASCAPGLVGRVLGEIG